MRTLTDADIARKAAARHTGYRTTYDAIGNRITHQIVTHRWEADDGWLRNHYQTMIREIHADLMEADLACTELHNLLTQRRTSED